MLRKFEKAQTVKVEWQGEVAAEVRGLSPADLAGILTAVGEELSGAFDLAEDIDRMKLRGDNSPVDAGMLADKLMSDWPSIVQAVGVHMPNVLSKIIAHAGGEPDSWEMVRDTYGFALQFEILVEIAKLTFNSPEAFKRFVGNVLALVDLSGTLTSASTNRPKTRDARPSLAGGSTTSSPSSRS